MQARILPDEPRCGSAELTYPRKGRSIFAQDIGKGFARRWHHTVEHLHISMRPPADDTRSPMIALSHTSALRYLRSQSEIKRLSPSKAPSSFGISRYDVPRLAQRFAAVGDGTVHVLATEQRRRRSIGSVTCHLAEKIPPNGIVHVEGDTFCSAPELCFLQMARVLPVIQLTKLGFELCGCYALAPDGHAIEQPALTSKGRIGNFLKSAKGARGVAQARQALTHIVEGSASPRETALTMLLCMPPCWGGYGFSKPQMNYPVCAPDPRRAHGVRQFYCDLFWPSWNLAVEYDSKAHHSDERKIVEDQTRATILTSLGISVISLRAQQVDDPARFEHAASAIASHRKRKRPLPKPDAVQQDILREFALNSAFDIH